MKSLKRVEVIEDGDKDTKYMWIIIKNVAIDLRSFRLKHKETQKTLYSDLKYRVEVTGMLTMT